MIDYIDHGDIAEIVMTKPPVNALGVELRAGLAEAISRAVANAQIVAVVIRGRGKLFSAGADITEFGKPLTGPSLPDVINTIEACAKPVVAAIHGMALGGGCEIALGCHYRIAASNSRLGLPEVTLGLLPGAGGTQRLPRLVGVEAALDMIVSGSPVSASKAAKIGLVDKVVDEADLESEAITFARSISQPRRISPDKVLVEDGVFERFEAANARKIKNLDAPRNCILAVKAATELPIEQGMQKERELFLELMSGNQSKSLRHMFQAERAASKIDNLPTDVQLRPIASVGVIGAGTMGGGISMNFLSAGIPVTLVEIAAEALTRGTGVMRKNYEATAAKGRLTNEQVEAAMDRLTPTTDFDALSQCDLIIEAVYENMDIKKEMFARLDAIAKPGAILASNTSYLSIDEIAMATSRPQDVVGLHFFSPANVMKLVEVVRGAKTAPDVLATAMDIARRIGKTAVVSGVCFGFIGNRMLIPRQTQAAQLLLDGATPEQIDRVHTEFGMPMGPFQMADLAGVDIGWHRDAARIESLRDALCAMGRWGQKTSAGYYDYDEKRKPLPSLIVADLIEEFRAKAGITPRVIDDAEIVTRTLYTMVNEGAKILEEGIAQRASDIDVVWNYGYGWPRYTGGPMFWASQVGLPVIVEALERYPPAVPEDFTLAPLLVRSAKDGEPLERDT